MFAVVFAIISLLLFYKLFRAFGRTQNIVINVDGDAKEKFVKIFEEMTGNAALAKQKTTRNNPLQNNIIKLQNKIPNFSPAAFLKKAEEVFDAIFDAFVNAQHGPLQAMLSSSLYNRFADMIKKREEQNFRQEMSIKHNKTSITTVKILKKKASLTVEFEVTQMSAMLRADGTPIDNPNRISRDVLHKWIFEREYSEPNWILAGTSSVGK
jgi:predicted lipid-binding transport protein (Tim44 family)